MVKESQRFIQTQRGYGKSKVYSEQRRYGKSMVQELEVPIGTPSILNGWLQRFIYLPISTFLKTLKNTINLFLCISKKDCDSGGSLPLSSTTSHNCNMEFVLLIFTLVELVNEIIFVVRKYHEKEN